VVCRAQQYDQGAQLLHGQVIEGDLAHKFDDRAAQLCRLGGDVGGVVTLGAAKAGIEGQCLGPRETLS
jgi:hypothetical protein